MWINSVMFVQFAAFYQGYESPDGQNIEWGIHYLSFGIPAHARPDGCRRHLHPHQRQGHRERHPVRGRRPNERPASVPEVPIWTYVLPVVPVALSIVFQWDSVPALFLAAIIAFFGTGYMKTYKGFVSILNSTAKTAIGDIGSLIIMLLVLRFFQHAAVTVMADFGPALTAVVPNNEFILALAVCILAPLALFRGPLELYGAGSAVISILMGMGVFNSWFLFAMLVVPSMTCISSCVTQSWNMWAVEYNELEPKTFLKNGVPVYWLCTFPIMGLASLLLF